MQMRQAEEEHWRRKEEVESIGKKFFDLQEPQEEKEKGEGREKREEGGEQRGEEASPVRQKLGEKSAA